MKISVIIAAGGSGKRIGGKIFKQLLKINKKPILYYSIKLFNEINTIDEIIIVANKLIIKHVSNLVKYYNFKKVKKVIAGGNERQYSVQAGLDILESNSDHIVLIHDAVRPFITKKIVYDVIAAAKQYKSAVVACPVKDTIKYSKDGLFFNMTPERKSIWNVQTPQGFDLKILKKAYKKAKKDGFLGSDDSSLVERIGINPAIVHGEYTNIKITTPEDLIIAKYFIKKK